MAGPTAWSSDYPLVHGKQIGNYDIFIQPYYGARERGRDLGHELFPYVDNNPGYDGLHIWEKGIVTGCVDNGDGTTTITDSTKTWGLIGSWNNPWISLNGSNLALYAPTNWAMGVGNDDVTQAICGPISINTATTAKLVTRFNDLVVSKQVPNMAFFVGQPYYIYAAGEPFWYQQWPEWSNVPRRAYGTMTSGTTTTMRVNNAFWKAGAWVGKELMVRDNTGTYFRQTITANTTDITTTPPAAVVTFTPALTHAVDGDYAIIDAGGRFLLGHVGCDPFVWYTGEMTGSYSHPSNDKPLVMAPVPQGNSPAYSEGQDPTLCPVETTKPMFDINLWSDPQNVCGVAGHAFNPNVTKSLRWLQRKCREMCGGFIPVGAPHGSERSAFNNFVTSTWFANWGATSYSGTIGAGGTNGDGESGVAVSIGGSIAYDELPVFWAVTDSTGNALVTGEGKLSSSSFLVSGPADPMYTGKPIQIAPGEKRFFPRRFERMFGITRWTPDADPDSIDGTGYIIPPREPLGGETAGPGTWIHTPPSDHYSVTGLFGGRAPSTLAVDAIADGHIARYGQSFFDPTTGYGPNIHGDPPPPAIYLDRTFSGKRSGKYEFSRNQSRSGCTAVFTSTQLTDITKNFWVCDFWGGTDGVLYVHSGTDSISGITVILASKASSAFFTQTPVRFPGHVIQGQTGADGSGNPIWASCLITAQASITHLTLATAMPSVSNWRIREPDSILDIWKDRDLYLTPIDADGNKGSPILTTVSGLSDTVIFYPAVTYPAGTVAVEWMIDDPRAYGVYKRVSGKWKPCSGADSVRLGIPTPTNFHAGDVFANEPDVVVRYGMMGPDDRPAEVQNQLKYGIDVLMDTPDAGSWISKGENNRFMTTTGTDVALTGDPSTLTLSYVQGVISGHWGTNASFSFGPFTGSSSSIDSVDQAPTASAGSQIAISADGTNVDEIDAGATINYAYFQTPEPDMFYGRPTHTDKGWGYPAMDSSDTAPFSIINCNTRVDNLFLSVSGAAYHVWFDMGALSSDGAGHEDSGKIWNTTEPPFPSVTTQVDYQLLDDGPPVTCTTDVQSSSAGNATGKSVILDTRVVRHWNNGFHA